LSVDSCICGDIVNELPLAQPTVSQHLKELKNANIIKGSIEGTYLLLLKSRNNGENQVFGTILNQLKDKCC
jgi:DNA-binding transcriptional ArsR family regulator